MEQTAADTSLHEPVADAAVSSCSRAIPAADPTNISSRHQPRRNRWIRITIAAIKAVLFLELAGLVLGPLTAAGSRRRQKAVADDGSDSDLDPADVLLDYLTGRTGLAAVQLLRNDQLQAAVDNLISEDFEELGVTDRGAEIRRIVDEIIEAREKGVPATPVERQQRVGLGKVGPLRYRNTKQGLARAVAGDRKAADVNLSNASPAVEEVASIPSAADGGAGGTKQQ